MNEALRDVAGEALGTFVIVAAGTSAVALAVITGTLTADWQVAAVWGVAVFAAIRLASAWSRAHLNPAVTLAVAATRPAEFRAGLVPRYVAGQLLGAVAGACLVWAVFASRLEAFEAALGLVRGGPGSERAAMIFGEYFPNPAVADAASVSPARAFGFEAAGTAAMMLAGLASRGARPWIGAAVVAATVSAVILVAGPVTMAGLNPARDFGPRLVAWFAGYGDVAIPGPLGGFWVYLAGPSAGALAAASAWRLVSRRQA